MIRKKGLLAVLAACVFSAGFLGYSQNSEAGEIAEHRGRVSIDLADFVLVDSTSSSTSEYGLVAKDDGDKYLLHYDNSFTDRNNLGCTYRTADSLEMTDVTAIQMYAYTQQESNDKILFYVDPGSNTYYHRMHRSDVTEDLVKGDGTVKKFSSIFYSTYGATPQDYKFNIDSRYGEEYVYLGLSHEWQLHDACFYLDNRTIASSTQGCVNLVLKKHNITLLEPEQIAFVQADGTEKEMAVFANLTLGLEDGSYEVGETGAVYRDESITFNYTLKDAEICKLEGYRFYSDAEKTKLLYTMNVEAGKEQSSFTFDAALIKKLEEKAGQYQLGDIYLEPIFTINEVDFEFSPVVPEYGELEVVPKGTNTYELREIISQKVLGTFTKNASGKLGDVFTIDYTVNADYDGPYKFRYYEIRECEAENQVSTTEWTIAHENADAGVYDIEKKYNNTYFWLRAHVGKDMKVELSDMQTIYSNKEVEIEEAKVTWQGDAVKVDEGDILYQYYTDASCEEAYLMEEFPINAGTYYVKATLRSSDEYDATESNVATIVINKATPTLSKVRAQGITYGQTLGESAGISGTAAGVSKSTISGTFTWVDSTLVLDAGTRSGAVVFTPNELYAQNYEAVEGKAAIQIAQAEPVITIENKQVTFCGGPVSLGTAKVTGIYGEETGQVVTYEYYPTAECNKADRSLEAPSNAGTYYVLVSAQAKGNYAYYKTEVEKAATLTILPYETSLIQIPVGVFKEADKDGNILEEVEENEYRVYVRELLPIVPKGTIQLDLLVDGEVKATIEGLTINEKGYASFSPENVKALVGNAQTCVVRASYVPVENDSYIISANELEMDVEGNELYVSKHVKSQIGYGTTGDSTYFSFHTLVFPNGKMPAGTQIYWYNLENDLVKLTPKTGDTYASLYVTATYKVGTAVIRAFVDVPEGEGSDFYVSFEIDIKKATRTVEEIGETFTYDANPHTLSFKTREFDPATQTWYDVPVEEAEITYRKTDAAEYTSEVPVNAGVYHYKITIPETECYAESTYVSEDKLWAELIRINPAMPTVTIQDKIVGFTGEPQSVDEAVLEGVPGGTEVTGQVTYLYKGTGETVYESTEAPTEIGTYEVVATVAADGNYDAASSEPASLTIEKGRCDLEVENTITTYTGNPVSVEVKGYQGDNVTVYYRNSLKLHSEKTTEAPTEAGIYYVWAEKPEDATYRAAVSKVKILTICRADVSVAIAESASTTYTGKAVEAEALLPASVTAGNGTDISDTAELHYMFYKNERGTIRVETPVQAGTYYVKAISEDQRNYQSGTSEMAVLTIEKAVPVISITDMVSTYGEDLANAKISATATGVNGETLKGVFHILKENSDELLEVGEYEVDVVFEPEGRAHGNYTSATAKAVVRIEPAVVNVDLSVSDDATKLKGTLKDLAAKFKGNFTLYRRSSGNPSAGYTEAENPVTLEKTENGYIFEVLIAGKGNYDFKLEYHGEDKHNFIISEMVLEDVEVGEHQNQGNATVPTGDAARPIMYVSLLVISSSLILYTKRKKCSRG